jgi:hypothetical protein
MPACNPPGSGELDHADHTMLLQQVVAAIDDWIEGESNDHDPTGQGTLFNGL